MIPRLKLASADLLAIIVENVLSVLLLVSIPCTYWTDSQVVFCRIRKTVTQLKPYLANRVRKISALTSKMDWRYSRSAKNPVDYASWDLSITEPLDHPLWWKGPIYLRVATLVLNAPTVPPSLADLQQVQLEEKPPVIMTSAAIIPTISTYCALDKRIILLL